MPLSLPAADAERRDAAGLGRAWSWMEAHPRWGIAILFALSRLHLASVGTYTLIQDPEPSGLVGFVCQWDCSWYMAVARDGYAPPQGGGQSSLAFYPLFPLIMRGAAAVTGLPLPWAGALASSLMFLGALYLLFAYARVAGLPVRTGLLAVLLICLVPEGVVFSAAMSESTFLVLALGAGLLLKRGRPFAAGLVALPLTAARPTGILILVLIAGWIVGRAGWRGLAPAAWREPALLAPLVLAPLGLLAWWAYCFVLTGDAFAPQHANMHGWGWGVGPPWENVATRLATFARADTLQTLWSLLACAAALLLLRLRLHAELAFCLTGFLLMWLSTAAAPSLRFPAVLFPIYLGLAAWMVERRWRLRMVLAVFVLFGAYVTDSWVRGQTLAV